jgi:hypothetical protein
MQYRNPEFHSQTNTLLPERSVESRWSLSSKDLGAGCLGNAVRKRKFEVFGEELLDVRALDVFSLLEFDDLEDLFAPRKQEAL